MTSWQLTVYCIYRYAVVIISILTMLILYWFFFVILLNNQADGDFVLISSGLFILIPSLPGISLLLILSPRPIWGRVCLYGSSLSRAGGNLLQTHRVHHRDREWGRPDRLPWQTVAGIGPLWLAAGPAAEMRGRLLYMPGGWLVSSVYPHSAVIRRLSVYAPWPAHSLPMDMCMMCAFDAPPSCILLLSVPSHSLLNHCDAHCGPTLPSPFFLPDVTQFT